MMRLILLGLFCGAFASPVQHEWEYFKLKYNRNYAAEEELYRQAIFQSNLELIKRHNEMAAYGLYTFTLGVNEFADMSNEEFRASRNGYLNYKRQPAPGGIHEAQPVEDLPPNVDWRKDNLVTPIKDQGQCGSCWAFSAVASLEGQHSKATKNLVSLSEENLVDCSGSEGDQGCEGGLMDNAFNYIIKNKGIDTEEGYPYVGQDESCKFKPGDVGATMKSYVDVSSQNETALQSAAASVGPISVAIDASSILFQLYFGGIYNDPTCSSTELDHGVTVVGYGSENGKDFWIVKNSWGTSWGEEGYIRMSRNKNNQCGIATQASYPVV